MFMQKLRKHLSNGPLLFESFIDRSLSALYLVYILSQLLNVNDDLET